MLITKIRQQTNTFLKRLLGGGRKQLLAGVIAASCVHLGFASQAEAHWWNRCYARAHYVVPSYCGWGHYGFNAYSFPSYSHWYSFGHVCYRPISYYHVYARPIVYRPIVYRPIYYRSAVLVPSSHFVQASSSDWFGEHETTWSSSSDMSLNNRDVWRDDSGVWHEESAINLDTQNSEWPIDSDNSVPAIRHSVAKPKTLKQTPHSKDLKQLTWEEALYGPAPTNSAVRFVAYQNDSNQGTLSEIAGEDPTSGDRIVHRVSAESILVDEMVRSGKSFEAHQTLHSFVAPSGTFDSSLQLRSAVLSLFASKDPIAVELILDRFNEACAAGAELDHRALGMPISDYLAPSNIDVSNTLNEFSKLALRSERTNVSQLLIVATILRLDGEKNRSKIFAQAAFDQAAEAGSLQWNSLIIKLLQ